jgi:hypothetical protein
MVGIEFLYDFVFIEHFLICVVKLK